MNYFLLMRSANFKLLLAIILFFCYGGNVFSQVKKTLFNNCLWIKNENQVVKNESNLINQELELKKYFNFNPAVDFSKDKIVKKYKNLVTKNSSLFVVFKSASKEENNLLSIERGSFKSSLSNEKIVCDKEVSLNKGDAKKGVLLSYLYNKNSLIGRKNGNLIFDDLLFEDKESINQLAELIYIPRCVSIKEKEIIESYLSLKYGISLNEGRNYYNSKGDKIWDFKQNDGFNKRITGIGADELVQLNQKQSKNALEDGLILGLNKIKKSNNDNEIVLKNIDFLLWGDNDKATVLEKSEDVTQKRIKRVWKVKTFSDSITSFKTQIKIDKKLMPVEVIYNNQDTEFIWLAIDNSNSSDFDYKSAKYIKATSNDENEIVFDNVEFSPNSDYFFTLVKAKENPNNIETTSSKSLAKSDNDTNNLTSQFKLYPNPIKTNEKFTVQFNLNESSKVVIQIADINGKIIRTKDLGFINNYSFTESLPVSGTYLIMVYVNEKLETTKLIVN